MENNFDSEDDIQVHVGNSVVLHMTAVRLKFRITKENVAFRFSQKRINPFDLSNKEFKTEQVISGYSEPVDNSSLPAVVYQRQPFANTMFQGSNVFVHFAEKVPNPLVSPFYFHPDYYKNKLSMTLKWNISDRSFFTRLVNLLSLQSYLTLEVTTDMEDKEFEKFCLDPSLQLPNLIGITSLLLT